jgi:SAM-dependent methyltransferase
MEPNQYKYMFEVEDRHWWYAGNHENFMGLLRRENILKDGVQVLDAGCGTGKWLQLLKTSCRVNETGIDYNPLALELAKTRGHMNLCQGDINQKIFPDASFDLITSFDVICNSNVDDDTVMRNFHDSLKEGGHLLLTVPAYRFLLSKHDAVVHQNKRYRRKQIKRLMESHGFEIVRLTFCVSLLFPFALIRRIFGNLKPAREADHNEVKMPATWVNNLFLMVMKIENYLLRLMSMPFGLSVMVLAKKTSYQGSN